MKHTFKILRLDVGEWFIRQDLRYNDLSEKEDVALYGPFPNRKKARTSKKMLEHAFNVVDNLTLDIF